MIYNQWGVLGFRDYAEWNLDKEIIKWYNLQFFHMNILCASLRLIKKTIGLIFHFLNLEYM
jgi:hypothetical protein